MTTAKRSTAWDVRKVAQTQVVQTLVLNQLHALWAQKHSVSGPCGPKISFFGLLVWISCILCRFFCVPLGPFSVGALLSSLGRQNTVFYCTP